jgi:uncharacterized membrane protein
MTRPGFDGGAVRAAVLGLVGAGIVHICATFATPYVLGSGAPERLAEELAPNQLVVLRPPTPQTQLIPFQDPHTYHALCRYDVRATPVLVRASLAGTGWTLSIYTASGENFYFVPGQDQRQTEVSALLVPTDDEHTAVASAFQGAGSAIQVPVPAPTGVVVLRAPVKAQGYRSDIEARLAQAACSPYAGSVPSRPSR